MMMMMNIFTIHSYRHDVRIIPEGFINAILFLSLPSKMIESHTSLILFSSMTIITFHGSLIESNQFIYELMTSLLCICRFIAVLHKVFIKFLTVKM